jgi:1,2-dihydroxy-3-keto-5-methylthiopentene dioxygenase
MARLEYQGKQYTDPNTIASLMSEFGLKYEKWGTRSGERVTDSEVLDLYKDEIKRLSDAGGYVTADLVALTKETPNLDVITAKFDKKHHHTEDEVRFVVEGEGVFELASENDNDDWLKFTSEPGDLIVIPSKRRHIFYLTEKKNIRCIRLFQTKEGWQAIY